MVPTDYPRAEIMRRAQEALLRYDHHDRKPETCASAFFKYTCERCGERNELVDENNLRERGECSRCGHVQEITRAGFTLIVSTGQTRAEVVEALRVLGKVPREDFEHGWRYDDDWEMFVRRVPGEPDQIVTAEAVLANRGWAARTLGLDPDHELPYLLTHPTPLVYNGTRRERLN